MTPSFLLDLGIAVAAALLFSVLFYRLGLPMIAGQLVAGMLVGPYAPYPLGLIRDTTSIDFLANLGIILLLFVIGLEMDPRKFGKLGLRVVIITSFEFLVSFLVSVLSALTIGWSLGAALFLGSVLGLSSTAIVAKLLTERSPEHQEGMASTVMMVLVLEDLIAVFLLFLTPELAGAGQFQASSLVAISGKAVLLFGAAFVFGRSLGPRLINLVSQYELEIGEVSFLLALSFGFLFGVLSEYLGFSPGIGALLVGFFLPMKHSRYVRDKILPLKEAFIVFFFLSMGTLVNASSALALGLPLVIVMVGAVLGKFAGGFLGAKFAKIERPLLVGSILIPRGEFSLVLAKAGVDSGLVPPQLYQVAGFAVLITTLTSSIVGKRFAQEPRS